MAKVRTSPRLQTIKAQGQQLLASLTPLQIAEGIVLALATPFLLFPTQLLLATAVFLILLALVWIITLPTIQPTPYSIPLLLFAITLFISILVTADPILTLPKATGILLGLALWRLLLKISPTKKHLYLLIALFLLLSLSFTLLGALNANWLFKIPGITQIINLLPNGLITIPEASPEGVHANQLAGTMLFFWPLLLAFWPEKGWLASRHKYWLIPTTLLITFLLILTQSRTGWLAAVGSVGFLLLCWSLIWPPSRPRLSARTLLVGSFITAVGLILWIGPETFQTIWDDPVQQTAVGSLNSIGFRQEVWRWSITASSDFAFTGTGLGSFRQVVRRLYPLHVIPTYDIAHAHNIFLQTALDLGLPGLIAYLSLLGLALWQGWQVAKHNVELRPFSIGLLASQVAFHIFGLTDAISLGAKPSLLFWFSLALLAILYNLTFPTPKST